MPQAVAIIDVVGLTPALLEHMPRLRSVGEAGFQAQLGTVLPAVTCSAQATLLTGELPRTHGIVGNGWYFRDLSEVWLWRQSNRLVTAEKLWETARRRSPEVTCAKAFWWYNMYSSADIAVTPRPVYWADGRKSPGIYTQPHDLKYHLESKLGEFPLFNFWGPGSGLAASEWIANCARTIHEQSKPTISLVYLPHLDYDLQRFGSSSPEAINAAKEIDHVAGDLCDYFQQHDVTVFVISEYGITDVNRPVHINRRLREAGLLQVVHNPAGELLDTGASRAFAVADHQIAHVYVSDLRYLDQTREALADLLGIASVLDDSSGSKREAGLDHARSGELVVLAERDAWFTYYYWLDDARAPDFARCVEIHRKPGYDPAELFFDSPGAKVKAALRLAQKKLGFRYVMDVITLDAERVRGSHGLLPQDSESGPVLLCSNRDLQRTKLDATEFRDLVLEAMELPPEPKSQPAR